MTNSHQNAEHNVPVIDLLSASGGERPSRAASDRNNEGDESGSDTGSSSSWIDEQPLDQVAKNIQQVHRAMRQSSDRSGPRRVRRRRRPPRRAPRYDFDADEEPESGESSETLESPRPRPRIEEDADDEEQYTPTRRRTITLMPHPPIPQPLEDSSSESVVENVGARARAGRPRTNVTNVEEAHPATQYVSSGEDDDRSSSSSVVPVESSAPPNQRVSSGDEPELMDLVSPEGSPQRPVDLDGGDVAMAVTGTVAPEQGVAADQSLQRSRVRPAVAATPPIDLIEPLSIGEPSIKHFEPSATRASPRLRSQDSLRLTHGQNLTRSAAGERTTLGNSPTLQQVGAVPVSLSLVQNPVSPQHFSPRPQLRSVPVSPRTPTGLGLNNTLPAQVEKLALNALPSSPVPFRQAAIMETGKKSTLNETSLNRTTSPSIVARGAAQAGKEVIGTPSSQRGQAAVTSGNSQQRMIARSSVEAALADVDVWGRALWAEAEAAYRHFAANLGKETTFQCASVSDNMLLKAMRQVGQLLGARPLTVPNSTESRFVELVRPRNATTFPESEEDFRRAFDNMLTRFFIAEHSTDALTAQEDARNKVSYLGNSAAQTNRSLATGRAAAPSSRSNPSTSRVPTNNTTLQGQDAQNQTRRDMQSEQPAMGRFSFGGQDNGNNRNEGHRSSGRPAGNQGSSALGERRTERTGPGKQSSGHAREYEERGRRRSQEHQGFSQEYRQRRGQEHPKKRSEHAGRRSGEPPEKRSREYDYDSRRTGDYGNERSRDYTERRAQEYTQKRSNNENTRREQAVGTMPERSQGEERRRRRSQGRRGHQRHGSSSSVWDTYGNAHGSRGEERSVVDTPRIATPPDRVGGRIEKRKRKRKTRDLGEPWDREEWDREYSVEPHRFRRNSRDDRYHRRKRRFAQQHDTSEDGARYFYNHRKQRRERRSRGT